MYFEPEYASYDNAMFFGYCARLYNRDLHRSHLTIYACITDKIMPNHSKQLTHPKYRPDIDGLRAIAVLSVVVFHSFPSLISAGFIGVDIFFVISGFLISGIIFSNLEHDRFSLVEFYRRRINRIFPALLLVLISSFAFGWFVLLADEYKQLGKHIVGGAGFFSNILLWRESGYFDNAAELKPLLHLWSLAIEEQFYIFWPLLLAFVWKRKWSFVAITATVAVVSFAVNIYTIGKDTTASFFLPAPRFWELMIGGLLAYIALHKPHLNSQHKNAQSILGVVLLAIGMLLINKERAFPGWWALLPTLGAFFIISAGQKAWFNNHVLSNRLFVWFGLISYPLYLWHWPVLSFAHIIESETPSFEIRFGCVVISILLAWLTFRLIEKPIRFGKHGSTNALAMIFLMLVTGSTGYLCFKKSGFDGVEGYGRIWQPEKSRYISYFENSLPEWKYFTFMEIPKKFRDECNFYDIHKYRIGQATRIPIPKIDNSCYTRNTAYKNSVFIWGDSHAQQLNSGLKNNLPDSWQILQVASSGCIPNPSATQSSATDYCDHSNWFALKTINETKPDVVIVAQNGSHTLEKFEEVAIKLKEMGVKKVVFTGPTPHWTTNLPKIVVRKLLVNTPRRTYIGIDHQVLKANLELQQNFQNSEARIFVNIIDLFCDQEGCLTYLGDDNKTGITTWDYGHLSPIASNYLAKNLLVNLIIDGR